MDRALYALRRPASLSWPRPHIRLGGFALVAGALVAEVGIVHFAALDRAPSGFFVDEAGIDYAAQGIALDGRDEHGVAWPLYFQGFGDYKNPLTIYLAALVVRLTGSAGIVTLRGVTSALALVTAALLGVLAWQLWHRRWVALGTFAVAGVTPWLFTVGRTAFELSALPATLALFLVLWLRADRSRRWIDGVWAGAALGLTAYSYTTMRLGTLLLVLALVAVYLPWRRGWPVISAGYTALLVYLPIVVYARLNPDALTARFSTISIFTTANSLPQLVGNMWRVYTSAYSPAFLFETNYFHQGGELLITTLPLLALGLYAVFRRLGEPFWRLILAALVLAPVPAALTFDLSHEYRNLEAAPLYLLVAALGAVEGSELLGGRVRPVAAVLALALAFESISFLDDYFTRLPDRISGWNQAGYGSAVALARADAASGSGSIAISQSILGGEILFAFYAGEPVTEYRRSGAAALGAVVGDTSRGVPVGTIAITTPNESVPGATRVGTVYWQETDEWGRPRRRPAYAIWRG